MNADTSTLTSEQRLVLAEKQLLILDVQVNRIVADIESEKETRNRVNQDLVVLLENQDKRLRIVEKSVWIGFGILAAIQVLLKFQ